MEVLLVLPGLWESGATRVNLDLAREWSRAGHATTLFVPQQRVKGRLADPEGVPVVYGSGKPGRFLPLVPEVMARLVPAARRADVVVSGSEVGFGLVLGWLAARVARRPFVTVVHASPSYMLLQWTPRRMRRLTTRALAGSDAAVCVAGELVDEVVGLGVPRDRVTHIVNGRDVAGLRRRGEELRRRLPVPERPVVVAVGRLVPQKGFDVLVRAHAAAVQRGADHRVRIVGDGPELDDLRALARELGCEETVEFAGFADDVAAVMADASAFCLSSRHEGTPLVLLEAMALGVPVVATDCSSGVRELLGDGRYGEVVPVESVDALADALVRHVADPGVLQARIAAAHEHIEGFSTESTARQYVAFLQSVLPARAR